MMIRHRFDAKLSSISRIRQRENELFSVLWHTPHRLPKVCFCLLSRIAAVVAIFVVGFEYWGMLFTFEYTRTNERYAALFTTVRHQNRHTTEDIISHIYVDWI